MSTMARTVAIAGELSSYRDALKARGFRVIPLTEAALDEADAIVVDGMEDDLLGMQDAATLAPVIDADGMTPEEVADAVEQQALNL